MPHRWSREGWRSPYGGRGFYGPTGGQVVVHSPSRGGMGMGGMGLGLLVFGIVIVALMK